MFRKYLCLYFVFLFPVLAVSVNGQGEGNIWVTGINAGLDFNSGNPVAITTAITGHEGCAAVCDPLGRLLFYTEGRKIWNRNHQLMPDGYDLIPGLNSNAAPSTGVSTTQQAVIVPMPGSESKYYVFSLEGAYSLNNLNSGLCRLYYCVVDMNLDNGLGNTIPGRKSILIDTGLTEKMTVVAGTACNIWLVVRSRYVNEYKSYEINVNGIGQSPVISVLGHFPQNSYFAGTIKFSPSGKKMAAACYTAYGASDTTGIELYDFDRVTGKLSNADILDTLLAFWGFYGTAFSPDESKLYGIAGNGKVFQYDLSTLLFTKTDLNISKSVYDIKLAPDGKIYFSGSNHLNLNTIHFPDRPGILCQVEPDYFTLGVFPPGRRIGVGLPNAVISAQLPASDTVYTSRQTWLCPGGGTLIAADSPGFFYQWNNGAHERAIVVDTQGTYVVGWQYLCTYHVDTFYVKPPLFPVLDSIWSSCEGGMQGGALFVQKDEDTTVYNYTWINDLDNSVLYYSQSSDGDTFSGLNPGRYQVKISTLSGCDTTFILEIGALPAAKVWAISDTTIASGQRIQLWAKGGVSYQWSPSKWLDDPLSATPFSQSYDDIVYTVTVTNEYGCQASEEVKIYIIEDFFIPNAFSPNGDGINDEFKIENISSQKILEFRIFNRWGEEIFSAYGLPKGWDGTFNGKPADVGTYHYAIRLAFKNGSQKLFKGTFTLLR